MAATPSGTDAWRRDPQPRRFDELDALRGIAALIVLFGHGLRSTPYWGESSLLRTLDGTPAHLFVAGREAVVLFFILSGFVLSLPFWAGKSMPYSGYAIKRVFRIYVPYLVAMTVALGLYLIVGTGEVPGMSEFFNKHWSKPLTRGAIVDHLLFIKPFDSGEYGMVYWSLIHELRVSLIFPFVMFGVMRARTGGSLALAAAGSALGTAYCYARGWRVGDGSSEWPVSLHIVALFIVGALIAKHRESLVDGFRGLKSWMRVAVIAGGGTVYLYARKVTDVFGEHAWNQTIEHWLIAGGAVTVVVAVMSMPAERSVFHRKPLLALGQYSYGLYLYHAAILWALVYVLHDVMPLPLIVALVLPVSLAAAWISFRWIEQPAMERGRVLAAAVAARRRLATGPAPVHQRLFTAGVWNRAATPPAFRIYSRW